MWHEQRDVFSIDGFLALKNISSFCHQYNNDFHGLSSIANCEMNMLIASAKCKISARFQIIYKWTYLVLKQTEMNANYPTPVAHIETIT